MVLTDRISNGLKILHRIENGIICILLGVLILFSFFQIAGRLLFGLGLSWADPVIYHLVLWTGLAGAAIATREKEHINIDIITRFLAPRLRHLVQFFTNIFSAVICIVLMDAGRRFVVDETLYGSPIVQGVPTWMFQVIIPLAFGIIAVRFLAHSILDLRRFFTNGSTTT